MKDKKYQESMRKITNKFMDRGYNRKQVEKIGKKVGEASRDEIRTFKRKKNNQMGLCISQNMITMQDWLKIRSKMVKGVTGRPEIWEII